MDGRRLHGRVHRPLVLWAPWFLFGTWWGMAVPLPSLSVALTCLVVCLGVRWFLTVRWPSFSLLIAVLTGVAVVCAACASVRLHEGGREWDVRATGYEGEHVVLEGWVQTDPAARLTRSGRVCWTFRFAYGDARCARVAYFTADDARVFRPRYGDRWRIAGRCREDGSVVAKTSASRRLGVGRGNAFRHACAMAREQASDLLRRGLRRYPETASLLQALLLGYRGRVVGSTREPFMATGTLHIFAISGLHVGIVALLITEVLKRLRVSRVGWIWLLGPLLVAYTIATGARASAVRACVMALIYFAAPVVRRRPDTLSALAAAALVILGIDPWQLCDVGFIFSFVVVTGLVVLFPLVDAPLQRVVAPDPFRVEPEPGWMRRLRSCGRYLAVILAVSISAWLASAPLTLHIFGRVSLIAVVSNLVVIPLSYVIVLVGALAVVVGACCGFLAVVFNHVNLVLVSVLTWIMRRMAAVPYGSLEVRRPAVEWILAWYGILAVVAVCLRRRMRLRR